MAVVFLPLPLERHEVEPAHKPEAPPDLEKLRERFIAGVDALQRGDGITAVHLLSSFDFGSRAVEEYRLYFLANGYQLIRDRAAARVTLARLWRRNPRFVYREDAGYNLGELYASAGDARHAAEVYGQIAASASNAAIAASTRWQSIESCLVDGDPAAVLDTARALVISNPKAKEAGAAIAIVRSLETRPDDTPVRLTIAERLDRVEALLRDSDPQSALAEIDTINAADAPPPLDLQLRLNRGIALYQLHRFEDAGKLLDTMAAGPYRIAIPAIDHASRSYSALAAAINPVKYKFIVQRRRVGSVRVKVEGKPKPVLKPRYANVKTRVTIPDPVAKAKKEGYERLASERLEDLLRLPLADEKRAEALGALVAAAEAENQDEREQDLILQLVRIDPSTDAGIQHFWDEAWSAYARGDLEIAKPLLAFIAGTYHGPNIKRQAAYWHARCLERSGHADEANAIYRALGGAPYGDVYALYARKHGAAAPPPAANPLTIARADWRDLAERNLPAELRLAYELTALTDVRDARIEIQKNLSRKNQPYAEALLADLYASSGNPDLMMRSLRRAFPQIATVEQDAVPSYFLRMYYPTHYEDLIAKYSKMNGIDPFVVMGLILQESAFNPRARSAAGAIGLMQLMPATGKELGRRIYGTFAVTRLEDPETNIELGTRHFRHLVDLFDGNILVAVASYNAGQGNVQKWRHAAPGKPTDEFVESIPFSETRSYVKRVTLLASTYKRLSE